MRSESLKFYASKNGSSVPKFRNNLSVPSLNIRSINFFLDCLTLEDGRDRLSRNVGMELSFNNWKGVL
jgi:hypothetical protein